MTGCITISKYKQPKDLLKLDISRNGLVWHNWVTWIQYHIVCKKHHSNLQSASQWQSCDISTSPHWPAYEPPLSHLFDYLWNIYIYLRPCAKPKLSGFPRDDHSGRVFWGYHRPCTAPNSTLVYRMQEVPIGPNNRQSTQETNRNSSRMSETGTAHLKNTQLAKNGIWHQVAGSDWHFQNRV